MFLREYETTMILRPDLAPSVLDAVVERLKETVNGNGGKLLEINHWGKKRLAYEIEKQSRGIYFHIVYLGEGPTVKELERNLRISDNVMRYLTVQLAEKVNPDERDVKEFVRPQYEAEVDEAEEATELDADDDREQGQSDDDDGFGDDDDSDSSDKEE